jgi:uncharacterized spore protein YtfJ
MLILSFIKLLKLRKMQLAEALQMCNQAIKRIKNRQAKLKKVHNNNNKTKRKAN